MDSALKFYNAVKELVLNKGFSRNRALTKMKKDLKSFVRIEAIAQLKEVSTILFEEVCVVTVVVTELLLRNHCYTYKVHLPVHNI